MGGKTKQSQRTKNNVRPSSSGRSAELLNNAVRMDPGLMSASSGKVLPVLFSTLAAPLDPTLNPDLSLCLKKLNKKDPITKTKALQELCDLVKNGDVEDVVAALPSWAHYYRTLTTDTDHKVREATQIAHGVIVGTCGRRTAPQLRALLPAWLQAQYDEYAPAAAAASASLTSTFPASKLPDVISFCMAEVAAHLLDTLLGNAEAALSNKNLSAEEKELQAARQLTASLQGLEFFVQHLPAAHDAWLWAELAPLLQPPFWKMADHKAQQVRWAWCGVLGALAARFGRSFGAAHGARAARLLLAGAGPGQGQARVWGCLLLLLRHLEADAWLDKKDLLAKRIMDVLENGGWGDAKHLATMLLPLLAYLPDHMLTKTFYEDFFHALFKGLEKKSVISSKSERQAWITSLAECLRYLTLQPAGFAVEVGTAVHRTWLERALAPRDALSTAGLVKHSAAAMAALAKHWLRQPSPERDQLVRNFWQNVASTAVAQVGALPGDPDEIAALLDAHILLLQTLKTSFLQEARKPRSIKFADEAAPAEERGADAAQGCDAAAADRYRHNLADVVDTIAAQYFQFACDKQVANVVFGPLLTLLVEFDNKNLFLALARHFGADSVYGLYDKVLRDWLAGDTMRCRALVDIVFLLMKYLSEQEQDALLDSFKQFPAVVVERGIALCLAHPHCRAAPARRWLRAEPGPAQAQLRAVCARMLRDDADGSARGLLLMCLATDDAGEMMISEATVSDIMQLVCDALSPAAPALERLVGAAAALVSELSGAVDCTDLALALFRLQLHVQRGTGLRAEAWCELRAAWQDAAAASAAFRAQAVRHVRHEILAESQRLDAARLEHVAALCPFLLPRYDEARAPPGAGQAAELVQQLFDQQDDDEEVVEVFALRHDCMRAALSCPLPESAAERAVVAQAGDADAPELRKEDAVAFVNKLVFRAALLRNLLLHKDEEERPWAAQLACEPTVEASLALVLRDYAMLCSLSDGYAWWAHHAVLRGAARRAGAALRALAAALPGAARAGLRARMRLRGRYWSRGAARLDRLLPRDAAAERPRWTESDDAALQARASGCGFFHMLQAEAAAFPSEQPPLRAAYLLLLRALYLAHAHEPEVTGAAFLREAGAGRPADAGLLARTYYRHRHVMLYESDIATAEWRQVVSNSAAVEYLAELVQTSGWELDATSWDFTTITLCSLAGAVSAARDSWGCPKVVMLARSVLRLFLAVQRFVGSIRDTCLQREPSAHVAELPTEWKDIFAPDLHHNLFSLVLNVLGDAEAPATGPRCALVDALLPVTRALDWHALAAAHKSGPLSLARLLAAALRVLQAPAPRALQYLAHALLAALAAPLVLHDAERLAERGDADEEAPRPQLALALLQPALTRLQDLVDCALQPFTVDEDTCEMEPFTDSHSLALGYLLLVDAFYSTCQLARGDLVHHYLELCREPQHTERLLPAALRLLPAEVAALAAPGARAAAPAPHLVRMFLAAPEPGLAEPEPAQAVGALACRALQHAARWGAGAARGWWGAAPARAAARLQRVLRACVSPALVRDQLRAVAAHARDIADAEVTVHWSTSEVECVYRVEERALRLSVALGAEHPLPLPRVSAAGAPQHNTHWLAVYLAYQNGSVLNALRMWTGAVARRVEAAPQCYICYCRLHPGSGRLPKVVCHQCRNKFHAECLRKWFTTSSKSNCPLCRANF